MEGEKSKTLRQKKIGKYHKIAVFLEMTEH
jgi:hypothetical protein